MPRTDEQRSYERTRYATNARRRTQVKTASRWNRLFRKFGITRDRWETMFAAQGGACACCRKSLGTGFRACVDHDHATGAIRGIICFDCNTSIGKLGDDVDGLTRALVYVSGATAPTMLIDEHW